MLPQIHLIPHPGPPGPGFGVLAPHRPCGLLFLVSLRASPTQPLFVGLSLFSFTLFVSFPLSLSLESLSPLCLSLSLSLCLFPPYLSCLTGSRRPHWFTSSGQVASLHGSVVPDP